MMTQRFNSALLCAAVMVFAAVLSFSGENYSQVTADEYDVKAAFIFRIVKFVEWPDGVFQDLTSPFVIGIAGQEAVAAALETNLKDKTVGGRPILVRRVKSNQEVRGCHAVYISRTEDSRVRGLLEAVADERIMTIGESERFEATGGMITFVLEGNQMRFDVNVTASATARLKLSSKLLQVARSVRQQPCPPLTRCGGSKG